MSEETTVRIEKEVKKSLVKYCKNNGLKHCWFVSRSVEEKLKKSEKIGKET